jgi:hypothetical protein
VDPAQAAWLDLDERAAERTRVAAALAQLTERVAAGDVAGAESVADQAGALNRMLSAMVDAQLRRLGGQLRLKSGEYQHGVAELLVSANGYRLAADPLRATDAFWDAVTGLRAMRSAAGDEAMRDWAEDQLRRAREALAMLAVTGYRRDDLTGWSEPEDDRR